MATIGLDKLYYAKITEDASGNETYGDPQPLAKAMTAEIMGRQRPRPVSASAPAPSIWPMYIRSTML